jgi:hypothetical protein
VIVGGVGCAAATSDRSGGQQEKSTSDSKSIVPASQKKRFQEGASKFQQQFGTSGKADFSVFSGPCDVISNFLGTESHDFNPLEMAYFLELEVEGNISGKTWNSGIDIVSDMKHHQFAVFSFKGEGIRSTLMSAGGAAEVYGGLAFGFEDSILEWEGNYTKANLDYNPIPPLKALFSGNAGLMVHGVQEKHALQFDSDYNTIVGVYGGFEASVRPYFNFETGLGVTAEAHSGKRTLDKNFTRALYGKIKERPVSRILSWFGLDGGTVDVRLVTADGDLCPEQWPKKEPEKKCVIEVGSDNDPNWKKSLKMAGATCSALGGCDVNPLAATAAQVIASVGLVQETGAAIGKCVSGGE